MNNSSISNYNSEKRLNYLGWDEYFMGMVLLEIKNPTNKNATNAALILDEYKVIVSLACNGQSGNNLNTYYFHAEYKALEKINKGTTIYTASFPCEKCAELIVNKGISEIIYMHSFNDRSANIFKEKGMFYRKFDSDMTQIEIDFTQYCDNL